MSPPRSLTATARGFTLIELLVAISILALMAALSWRGLDGMSRAQSQTQQRANEVLTLQAGLAQWGADLEAMTQTQQLNAIDWNGQVLRLTRRSALAAADGLPGAVSVVAWTQRSLGSSTAEGPAAQWLRWESPALQTRGELQNAWQRAALWAQNPSDDDKRYEVAIAAALQWQIYYYRSDAWVNPLSSDAATPQQAVPPQAAASDPASPAAPVASAAALPSAAAGPNLVAIPEGVRLVLTLAPGQAISGVLTRDWVRPTLGGGKS
ncbi:MAG: type II secretion system protein J [Burkholderiaceae bacterium]